MEEKQMVNDILENAKYEIKTYTNALIETENVELRQALQEIRSSQESFEYELFKLATSKGYYNPPDFVKPEQISKVREALNSELFNNKK